MFEKGKHIFRKFVRKSVDKSNYCSYNDIIKQMFVWCLGEHLLLGVFNMKNNYYREYNRRQQYYNRTVVVYKERLLISIICITVFLFSLLLFNHKTEAANFSANSNAVKMYKSITVFSGDTLESIADEYMSNEYSSVNKYINEVLSINGMNSDTKLVVGNKIVILYYINKNDSNNMSANPVIEISVNK